MAEDKNSSNSNLRTSEPSIMALQFNDTRSLLDVVDNLRSHGISRYIDLPEIIVVGEQSAGKSSVLEAISGVAFPSKDNLCTRFATELVLRRGPLAPINIRIVAGAEEKRSESEREQLLKFNVSVSYEDLRLDKVIEAAKDAMGINETTKVFSSDMLRLEISGPGQPHLTLVDLPGLFQAGSRSQSDADRDIVRSLVLSYMKRPRSIILAVVSAKNDFNNQPITRHAREIDPEGARTLGLITKPDTLDEGSDSERFYIELAQNKDVKFRLGWHVLRNRDYSSRDFSSEERDRAEETFFSSGVWRSLLPSQVGVGSLKPRLSKILKDQILAQLPAVLMQIEDGIRDCTERLKMLGTSRATIQEQRSYLLRVSHSFSDLIKAATDGLYSQPFFGDASTDEGHQKCLRAILQNTLTEFAESMRKDGHTYTILDEALAKRPGEIARHDYIEKVNVLLTRSRGRGLPGTFDPMIIGQLFHEQRKPWGNLVNTYVDKVNHAVNYVMRTALEHVSDKYTLDGLHRQFIYPKMESLKVVVQEKVKEILQPHDLGHPITYNNDLTENVQKAQDIRRTCEIKKSLKKFLGVDYTTTGIVNLRFDVDSLLNLIVTKTEADMKNYASFTAADFMEAYYKIALNKVIDDVSVLAIETCLITRLSTIFSPATVLDIGDAIVTAVAAEDEESSMERARCDEKRKILEEGLRELKDIQGYRLGRIEGLVPLLSAFGKPLTVLDPHLDKIIVSKCEMGENAPLSSAQLKNDDTSQIAEEASVYEPSPPEVEWKLEDDEDDRVSLCAKKERKRVLPIESSILPPAIPSMPVAEEPVVW